MCAISGVVDYDIDVTGLEGAVKAMSDSMARRGPNSEGILFCRHAALAHKRLIVIDPIGGAQPMTIEAKGDKYTIIYNGELYNTEEIRQELKVRGYNFRGHSDTEVILTAFIEWGNESINMLNGIFAFAVWQHKAQRLTLARDRMGVKPLFYYTQGRRLIFSSEIKGLLRSGLVKPQLDIEGLRSIFLLAPARAPGEGVIKDVKELKRGHYLVFNSRGLKVEKYWDISAKPHTESYKKTVENTRELVTDAIKRQLVSDVPLCTFLSGGLDSGIISYIAAKELAKDGIRLTTYSVDYAENSKFFLPNAFQPSQDEKYIKIMSDYIKSYHINITLDNEEIGEALVPAMIARDLPGMADIDSSLLLFCRQIKQFFVVALSGECADEIFGGYPWYHNEEMLNDNTFPWSRSLDLRKKLVKVPEIKQGAEEWVREYYNQTVASADCLSTDSGQERKMRQLFMLNIDWFMQCLLDRKDRMTMYNGLEVRVPFCDYRLVEYAYNMPWKFKSAGGREKGILREAFMDYLPYDIVNRKKNPYPKTFSPIYLDYVTKKVKEIMADKSSVINQLMDAEFINEIINSDQTMEPFFGQLMRKPQLLGFIIQIDAFFKEYGITIV